jgi:hypothetical protein
VKRTTCGGVSKVRWGSTAGRQREISRPASPPPASPSRFPYCRAELSFHQARRIPSNERIESVRKLIFVSLVSLWFLWRHLPREPRVHSTITNAPKSCARCSREGVQGTTRTALDRRDAPVLVPHRSTGPARVYPDRRREGLARAAFDHERLAQALSRRPVRSLPPRNSPSRRSRLLTRGKPSSSTRRASGGGVRSIRMK